MLCERRVNQEKLANTITPLARGNREVVTTSSLRDTFLSSQPTLAKFREKIIPFI
jgi:hypothetical protein